MRYILIVFLSILSFSALAQVKKYFDTDSTIIDRTTYESRRADGNLLIEIHRTKDTVYFQAIKRRNFSKLDQNRTEKLYQYISDISDGSLDKNTPLVIYYYQGPDPCNMSGTATADRRKLWYANLAVQLSQNEKVNSLVVYSSNEGVDKQYPGMPAYFDKDGQLSKFFRYHYPCGSFMVMAPDGNIGWYYGEYGQATVLDVFQKVRYPGRLSITKYLDTDDKPLTREVYLKNLKDKYSRGAIIATMPDTVYQIIRSMGTLPKEQTEQMYTYFSVLAGHQLDPNLPVVVLYHQGADACNSSGPQDTVYRKQWQRKLANMLTRQGKNQLLVLYRSPDRVKELYPGLPAYFDKYNILGKFFKYRYGCGSVFMIAPNNNYACINGEYSKEWVVDQFVQLNRSKI